MGGKTTRVIRCAGLLIRCAGLVITMTGVSGCFTGAMLISSEGFRSKCSQDDLCVRMVAVEAVAEVGTAVLIAGGAAIAGAIAKGNQSTAADEPEPEQPEQEPKRATRRHDFPDWP